MLFFGLMRFACRDSQVQCRTAAGVKRSPAILLIFVPFGGSSWITEKTDANDSSLIGLLDLTCVLFQLIGLILRAFSHHRKWNEMSSVGSFGCGIAPK